MDAEPSEQRSSLKSDLLLLLSFLKPFIGQMLVVLAIIGGINLLAATAMWLVGKGVNLFLEKEASGSEAAVGVMIVAGLYAALGVGRAILTRLREPAAMRLAMNLLRSLRIRLYDKVQTLSFTYLDRLTSGQIIERATGDLTRINEFLTSACFQSFDAVIMGVIAIGFMLSMSWQLTLVVLLPYPLICWAYWRWARQLRVLRLRVRDQVDVMMTRLTETIAGVRVIRSFGRHEQEKVRYLSVIEEVFQRVVPAVVIRSFKLVGVYSIARLWVAVLVVVGGYMVMQGEMAVGYLLPFISYMMWLLWRAQALMEMGEHAQDARAALERVMALLAARPDVEDDPQAVDLPPDGRGEIVFENVSFAYLEPPHPSDDVVVRMDLARRQKGPDAVSDITLAISPGERIALVGPTGAGKSTIISLLPRFYDPTEGRVLIDGQDIRKARLVSLRREIGLVFQETFLFRGTIAENIALGRPGADREIMAAARMAEADEFIRNLPLGYDSEIGERGVSLSGGQRQRLAIARAILKRPRILVLDDAMAAVDAHTEYKIRKQLSRLMESRTTLIIAHRLATVRAADRVVVLREGRIDDIGTHDELAMRNEFYRQLCESQLETDREVGADAPAAGGEA